MVSSDGRCTHDGVGVDVSGLVDDRFKLIQGVNRHLHRVVHQLIIPDGMSEADVFLALPQATPLIPLDGRHEGRAGASQVTPAGGP